jgi:hypothetical protein
MCEHPEGGYVGARLRKGGSGRSPGPAGGRGLSRMREPRLPRSPSRIVSLELLRIGPIVLSLSSVHKSVRETVRRFLASNAISLGVQFRWPGGNGPMEPIRSPSPHRATSGRGRIRYAVTRAESDMGFTSPCDRPAFLTLLL